MSRVLAPPATAGSQALAGLRSVAPPFLAAIVVIAALEILKAANLLPITVPAPSQVAAALPQNWTVLVYHITSTIQSAALGYLCALTVAGVLAAIATAWSRAERPILTLGIFLDCLPLIALAPILMLWLGNGLTLHVVVSGTAAFFPLLVGTIQGFRVREGNTSELFHVLSASRWQRLRLLGFPSALPFLFAAMKVAAPLAVLGALIAEWLGTDRGMGTMITYALFSFNVPLVWLAILAVCALSASSYAIVALLERRFAGWSIVAGAAGRGV